MCPVLAESHSVSLVAMAALTETAEHESLLSAERRTEIHFYLHVFCSFFGCRYAARFRTFPLAVCVIIKSVEAHSSSVVKTQRFFKVKAVALH